MAKKHRLDADKASLQMRMEAGEEMDAYTVWRASETGSYKWAYATLSKWHKAGLSYISRWEARPNGGKPRPFFKWGTGEDAARPAALSKTVKNQRYVQKLRESPDRIRAYLDRRALRRRKTPKLDPIHAAMLGYRRCGATAWIKTNEEPAHTD